MNTPYVVPLYNFPEIPFSPSYKEDDFTESYNLADPSIMHDELHQLLAKLNLGINKVSIFRSFGYEVHGIHTDSFIPTDMSKIVWMFGQKHTMNWYNIKPTSSGRIGSKTSSSSSSIVSQYCDYHQNDVDLVYSYDIKGPVLVQAGIPHNVINYEGKRISFTIVPKILGLNKKVSERSLTMSAALRIFQQHL